MSLNSDCNNKCTTSAQQVHTNKNVKNVKKEKNNIYCAFFDDVWGLYPRKKGKAAVSAKSLKEINEVGQVEMTKAVERYKAEISANGTGEQYILHGGTFFQWSL